MVPVVAVARCGSVSAAARAEAAAHLGGRHAQVVIGQPGKPADWANLSTGANPAANTRFGSSNTAEVTARV